ncbi:uncharacterized protein PAC_03269 [Phialocephala subalpina]|uniref:Uncharacterized protein n=1 Tax=Phialocephala subalpina TaxID=576137 RepID=A0A1L7WKU1_9HELO|nr:uncharacterized protein PAC_03269 [Phialocephala subalpina]
MRDRRPSSMQRRKYAQDPDQSSIRRVDNSLSYSGADTILQGIYPACTIAPPHQPGTVLSTHLQPPDPRALSLEESQSPSSTTDHSLEQSPPRDHQHGRPQSSNNKAPPNLRCSPQRLGHISIVPLYTKDGVFMAQGFPTAPGTNDVQSAYEKTFSLITLSVTFAIHEIVLMSDEYAFARTSSEGNVRVKGSGGKSNEGNQELFVL